MVEIRQTSAKFVIFGKSDILQNTQFACGAHFHKVTEDLFLHRRGSPKTFNDSIVLHLFHFDN